MKSISITQPHPPPSLSPNSRANWRVKSIDLILPHPAKCLSLNGRVHPQKKASIVKRHRQHGSQAASQDHPKDGRKVDLGSVVSIVWFHKGMRPDVDNIAGLCKSYLDGICDYFQYNDRRFTSLDIKTMTCPNKDQACVLIGFPEASIHPLDQP